MKDMKMGLSAPPTLENHYKANLRSLPPHQPWILTTIGSPHFSTQ